MSNDKGSPPSPTANKLSVIPSEVEESRGETEKQFRGILRLRFTSLRMTIYHSDFVIVSVFVIRASAFPS
jgi:hypothetical protein